MALKPRTDVSIKNKKAFFEDEIIESFIAGIQLQGTEIKSIREGKAGLVDSYCQFAGGELYVKNMHIAEYFFKTFAITKLSASETLVAKKELRKLERKVRKPVLPLCSKAIS